MKALTIIIMLLLTSCTVNHYTCDCKHQAQFMPGQYTVPGIYYTPARPGHTILPSNIDLFKNVPDYPNGRIGIGLCDTISMNGKLGLSVTNPSCILSIDEHHDYKFGYGPSTPMKGLDIKGTRLIVDTLNVIK